MGGPGTGTGTGTGTGKGPRVPASGAALQSRPGNTYRKRHVALADRGHRGAAGFHFR